MIDRAGEVYELQLERVRLRAIALRRRRDGDHAEHASTRGELARLEERLSRLRADAGESLRDLRLASLLRLSAGELDLLWSVVAATMDPSLGPHLRELAGGEARHGMSLALHAMLAGLDHGAARSLALALTPLHPLIRYGLVEAGHEGVPAARPLTVPTRVATYLAGEDTIDDAVLRSGGVIRIEHTPHFDPTQLECVKQIVQALSADEPSLVVIEGVTEVGKRTAAALAALATRRRVIQLDATRLSPAVSDLEHSFVSLRRECLLDDALPLVAQIDELVAGEGEARNRIRALARLLDETPISIVLTSTTAGIDLGTERKLLRVTMPVPDVQARTELWRRSIGDHANVDLQPLAARYPLGAGSIKRATAVARLLSKDASLTTHDLVQGVRSGIAERLGSFARRVEVKQGWEDLVLGPDTLDQIKTFIARVRHAQLVFEQWGFGGKLPRGPGTTGLFSGPPGTGKTMVAGLIARELELELYQVDLSQVVSRWVGETGNQLARIFEAAEAGRALLLFDEADSLVAGDRDLLQRIERFGGVSILTTDLETSIDPALRRRLAAQVVFSSPEVAERTALWRRLLPVDAPRAESLDFEALAHEFPDMTGANIRNAVLAGAFLAASEGELGPDNPEGERSTLRPAGAIITQQHLERGGRGEYRAMGRVIRKGSSSWESSKARRRSAMIWRRSSRTQVPTRSSPRRGRSQTRTPSDRSRARSRS